MTARHDFLPGERVVARGEPMGLPDLTGTVIAPPHAGWAESASVWVRFDPPAAGDGHIHHSLLRRMTAEEAAALAAVRRCRACGCTDEYGCPEGCWWVAADLCSSCRGAEGGDDDAVR
jgi:hypothetical protein